MSIAKDLLNRLQRNMKPGNFKSRENTDTLPSTTQKRSVFKTINENIGFLTDLLGRDIGLSTGAHFIGTTGKRAGIVFIEGMCDGTIIDDKIIRSLLNCEIDQGAKAPAIMGMLETGVIPISDKQTAKSMELVVDGLLHGDAILFLDGNDTALVMKIRKMEKRPIEKPENEVTVLASKDSFTEDLETNCSLIIRRLHTPDLQFRAFTLGTVSHTKIKLVFIKGACMDEVVREAVERIKRIDREYVGNIGNLAELIEDAPLSLFPKYRQTQRPDMVARNLMEGRFAILFSDSPYAFVAPVCFWDNLKTMDDYSERSSVVTFLRFTRFVAFTLSIVISPLYVAFVTYNHAIVPPPLAQTIATGRTGVPFPTIVEVLILNFAITIIREASVRMPGTVGYFVSTLAAIVIGQAVVVAGYINASVIIVTAISGISSYAITATTLVYPATLSNYFMIILAGLFGMFGVVCGFTLIVWHLLSLESFGMPFMYPLVPYHGEAMKDTLIRAPQRMLKNNLGMVVTDKSAKTEKKAHE